MQPLQKHIYTIFIYSTLEPKKFIYIFKTTNYLKRENNPMFRYLIKEENITFKYMYDYTTDYEHKKFMRKVIKNCITKPNDNYISDIGLRIR